MRLAVGGAQRCNREYGRCRGQTTDSARVEEFQLAQHRRQRDIRGSTAVPWSCRSHRQRGPAFALHVRCGKTCLTRGFMKTNSVAPRRIREKEFVMNSDVTIGRRARRRIALRLLPFVFGMYVIAYIDRANVSLANLRMSADLGFSDRAYGLGVGMFFLGYVIFEVPGAMIVERWS